MKCNFCEADLGNQAVQNIVTSKWFCSWVCKNAAEYNAPTEALKFDEAKLPYHLISPLALEALAQRLQHGAVKYAERNWEKGLDWSRCYRAAIGHLLDFWYRQDIDQDSGLSHLSGAFCNLMFLIHYTESGEVYREFDNRPAVLSTPIKRTFPQGLILPKMMDMPTHPPHVHVYHVSTHKCMSCGASEPVGKISNEQS